MAIELRFNCESENGDYIKVSQSLNDIILSIYGCDGFKGDVMLDVTSAIKFAKTLRTEINKAKEEVDNGN